MKKFFIVLFILINFQSIASNPENNIVIMVVGDTIIHWDYDTDEIILMEEFANKGTDRIIILNEHDVLHLDLYDKKEKELKRRTKRVVTLCYRNGINESYKLRTRDDFLIFSGKILKKVIISTPE